MCMCCGYDGSKEAMQLEKEIDAKVRKLAKKGICAHSHAQIYSNKQVKCTDCGKVFESNAAHTKEYNRILGFSD